jgi:acyl carrier protein
MNMTEPVLAALRTELPGAVDPSLLEREETIIADLGVSSLQLITVVLTLQRQYGLDADQMIDGGMPVTIGDLVRLVQRKT